MPGIICFDHSHATGSFRGWICSYCNRSLGFARDKPETLRKLAEYLEVQHSLDKKTGGQIVEQGQPAIEQAAKQDEIGTALGPSDGAREEGQSSS